jgi:hypothetical protein
LGPTSLDANERSGHGARELKTVRLEAAAALLRLQLQQCHVNAHNPGNQVSPRLARRFFPSLMQFSDRDHQETTLIQTSG